MKPVLKHVAQASEIIWLAVCVIFLTPVYLVIYRRLLTRVGV